MTKAFSIDDKIQSYLDGEKMSLENTIRFANMSRVSIVRAMIFRIVVIYTVKCCSFFEGEGWSEYKDNKELHEWDIFFNNEIERGVNYPFLTGGEPSLHIDRLQLANQYWKHGMLFTNGIIPIPKDISFSIHVSIWGDEDIEKKLRGADCLKKIISNYQEDERVTFVVTITHQTVTKIKEIAELIFKINGKLIFNHYSPTIGYNNKIKSHEKNDNKYFRVSSNEDNLCLTDDDLKLARSVVDELIDSHGENVICSHYYNKWVTESNGIYNIDEDTGYAKDCATRNATFHKYFRVDHNEDINSKKCCIPFVDCKTCRGYAFSYPTLVSRMRRYLRNKDDFINWVITFDKWCEISFVGWRNIPDNIDRSSFWKATNHKLKIPNYRLNEAVN